jgi:hypothetical protein
LLDFARNVDARLIIKEGTMKKIIIFALIFLFAGCAYLDEGGRRDRDRHDGDRRDGTSHHQRQVPTDNHGSR